MSLLSFIHRREIRVDQDLLLSADFYMLSELLPFLTFTDEELLVIKRTFTQEEAEWLLNYNGECKIITAEPDDYEDLKVLETLEKRLHVEKAESISMNYIHGGETLLVFSDGVNSGKATSVANMVKLHPVKKKDIEVTLQVLLKNVNLSCSEVQSGTGATYDDMATANEIDRQTKSDDIPEESRRKELIRNRLKQMFDDGYSVVNIRLDGSAVEQRSITLTEFYKRHNIAQGRLVGSWRVFERGQLDEIIDAGIAKRALDNVLKKYTINISNYGRIVRNDHRKQLFDAVKKIEQDYIAYLKGKNNALIGDVKVQVEFKPFSALEKTFNELENYLRGLKEPGDEEAFYQYQDAVSDFLQREYLNAGDFVSKVRLRTTQLTFKGEQWKNLEFVNSVNKAVLNNSNFFDSSFRELLDYYIKLE